MAFFKHFQSRSRGMSQSVTAMSDFVIVKSHAGKKTLCSQGGVGLHLVQIFLETILFVQENFCVTFSRWFRWRGIDQLGKQKVREHQKFLWNKNVPNSAQKLALNLKLLNAAGPWSFYLSFTKLKASMLSWVLTGYAVCICTWLVKFYVLVNHHNLLLMDINDINSLP